MNEKEICRLFKSKPNPCDDCNMKYASEGDCHTTCSLYKEPKPSGGRLLSDEEISDIRRSIALPEEEGYIYMVVFGDEVGEAVAKAQRDLTVSIKDAEGQARVEGIFKWGEEDCPHYTHKDTAVGIHKRACGTCWLKRKEQEGVK